MEMKTNERKALGASIRRLKECISISSSSSKSSIRHDRDTVTERTLLTLLRRMCETLPATEQLPMKSPKRRERKLYSQMRDDANFNQLLIKSLKTHHLSGLLATRETTESFRRYLVIFRLRQLQPSTRGCNLALSSEHPQSRTI